MRRSVFFVVVAVTVCTLVVEACGSTGGLADFVSTADASLASPEVDGAEIDGAFPDVRGSNDAAIDASLPLAVGDPCRGIPVPTAQHFVTAGLCTRVIANTLYTYRQLMFAPNGDLFATTGDGRILRFRDLDGDGYFDTNEFGIFADSGGNGNNSDLDVDGGYLYAGSADGVKRWPWGPDSTDGGAGEDAVIGEASTGAHAKHTVHIWQGYLYVHSGSVANAADSNGEDYDDDRSLIRRFELSKITSGSPLQWLSGEIVSRGLRNANGFARGPTDRIFAVVNGIDDIGFDGADIHGDNPGEQVAEVLSGAAYGFPFCFTAQRIVQDGGLVTAGTQLPTPSQPHDAPWCAANSSKPASFIQAHSAPLDITFFGTQPTGGLPERYRGGAFIALHGSFDRDPATGYKVVWLPFDATGTPAMPTSTATTTTFPYETVIGGGSSGVALDGPWTWADGDLADSPRFSGVAVSPIDGALYLASDTSFYLYRVGQPNP